MIKYLPSILTSLNLVAGVVAILLVLNHYPVAAVILIILAALFDSMDGRVARKFHAESMFGKELDSLADLVSFGVAPAVVMYIVAFQPYPVMGYLLTPLFPLAGALRLARFNVQNIKGFFVGVPITFAGPALAVFAVAAEWLPIYAEGLLLLVLAYLMVSTFKVPKL